MRPSGRAFLLSLLAGGLCAADPEPDDPPLCREALAAHADASALAALDAEEQRYAADARAATRMARKLVRDTLGAGPEANAVLPEYEEWMARQEEARRRGKVICLCRQRRGDPQRPDCQLLYPVVIR